MNKECYDALIAVLEQVRQLVALPGNDFSWSCWQESELALTELDRYLSTLHSEYPPSMSQLQLLFAPTGLLQEVSISSGWGEQFLELARHFELTIRKCW